MGRVPLELAQRPSRVALAWHFARSSTPFGVTSLFLYQEFFFLQTEAKQKRGPMWLIGGLTSNCILILNLEKLETE